MGRTAGVIVINLSLGTAQFILDLQKQKVNLKDFGAEAQKLGGSFRGLSTTGVSDLQATSAALRVLNGGLTNNLRAAERFTSMIPGMGALLRNAFPVVGALALLGVFYDMAKGAYSLYEAFREAPEKANAAWRELSNTVAITADNSAIALDRLNIQIAKLEGKRQNSLKLMLDESKLSADSLAQSLEGTFKTFAEDLEKAKPGLLDFMTGQSSTYGVRHAMGGVAGEGGIPDKIKKVNDDFDLPLRQAGAKGLDALKVVEAARDAALIAVIEDEIKARQTVIDTYKKAGYEAPVKLGVNTKNGVPSVGVFGDADAYNKRRAELLAQGKTGSGKAPSVLLDPDKNLTDNQNALKLLDSQKDAVKAEAELRDGKRREAAAEQADEERRLGKPYENAIDRLKSQLAAVKAQAGATGLDENSRVAAQSIANAVEKLEEVNRQRKALRETAISDKSPQADDMRSYELQIAKGEAATAWATRMRESTQEIKNQILAQGILNAAIGEGYVAVRNAKVETELMAKYGESYSDPLKKFAISVDRQGRRNAEDATNSTETNRSVDSIADKIELETRLAMVQHLGAAAVRAESRAIEEEIMLRDKDTISAQRLIAEKRQSERAEDANATEAAIYAIRLKIDAQDRLTEAYIKGGSAAMRQAEFENKVHELMNRPNGASNEEIDAARAEIENAHKLSVAATASNRVNQYSDRLETLKEEKAVIDEMVKQGADQVETARAYRDIQNETLKVLSEDALAQGGAIDGIHAFFLTMEADGKKAAETIYQSLTSALDGVSDNMAKLLSGQKTAWKQMFQSLGEGMIKDQVKGSIQKGLGDVAKHFPGLAGPLGKIAGISTKPGDSPSNPMYVRVVGGGGSGAGGSGDSSYDVDDLGTGSGSSGTGGVFKGVSSSNPMIFSAMNAGKEAYSLIKRYRAHAKSANDHVGDTPPSDSIGVGESAPISPTKAKHSKWDTFGKVLAQYGQMATNAAVGAMVGSIGGKGTAKSTLTFPTADDLPARAAGGNVSASQAYLVGEKGPEILTGASGRIVDHSTSARILGSGGDTHVYHIDARGADIGVLNRIQSGMEQTRSSAITGSVRASGDQKRRTPQGAH